MVQVLSRSVNGLIKHFKVHDILRDLAMHEAGRENLVTVFTRASDDKKPNRIIRRASLQAEEKNSRLIEYVGPNTRSLLWFVSKTSGKVRLHCSNFRLLKVLEIVGMITVYEFKSLDELIHLKYLGIRECVVDFSCSLHGMRSLETLDVRDSVVIGKCDDFWTIETLRHVHLVEIFETFFDKPLPKATFSNLQTLKWVTVKGACDAKLPNLRKLALRNKSDNWVSITNLLETLHFVVSLEISVCRFSNRISLPIDIVYPKALSNYQNLQSLYLQGKWPENVNVEASMLPPHLLKLTLKDSQFNHNPVPELGKLNSLKKLCLRDVFPFDWEGPIICQEGFSALQYLAVRDMDIKDLTVAQGAMPKLTYLQVHARTKVHLPTELQNVTVETWLN